MKDLKNS